MGGIQAVTRDSRTPETDRHEAASSATTASSIQPRPSTVSLPPLATRPVYMSHAVLDNTTIAIHPPTTRNPLVFDRPTLGELQSTNRDTPTFLKSGKIRKWWSRKLVDDEYIHENLCRHLEGARWTKQLVRLLFEPQWAGRQVEVNDIVCLENDCSRGNGAVRDAMRNETAEERSETAKSLRLISDAVTLSAGFIMKNKAELWFQLHGRLLIYLEKFRAIREYAGWMETDAPAPKMVCLNEFLVQAGGPNIKIVPIGVFDVLCILMVQEGQRVACGCEDGRIVVINVLRSEVERAWKAHDKAVDAMDAIAVGRDGTRIVSGSRDSTAKVWDVESGDCLATFNGHTDDVNCVAVMEDGIRVVSGSSDRTARIWEIETGQAVFPPFTRHEDDVTWISLRDGEHVVTGGKDMNLRLWNVTTGAQVGDVFDGHQYWVTSVVLTPDKQHIVSGSRDRTVRVWIVVTHQQIGAPLEGHTDWVTCVAVSGDGRRIASGSHDKTIRVWDSESRNEVCEPLEDHADRVTGLSFLGDSDHIVSCSLDGTVRVWDVRRKKVERVGDRHEKIVRSVTFGLDGKYVVSGSWDKTLRIWDSKTIRQVGEPLEGHSDFVHDAAVTPNGRWVVSVSDDETVRGWDLESRELLHALNGHTDIIWCVTVTPKGDRAVTGSRDRTVRVWNLAAMDGSHDVLAGHSAAVWRVFVTDDGLRIVSVDSKDNVFVWELESENIVRRATTDSAWRLSRREVLSLVEESTVDDDTSLSIPLGGREISHGERPDAKVLASMESIVHSWALSPDKKTICVGLQSGQVGFMKLET